MDNFVKRVFQKEFEKLKASLKELETVAMGDVYDLADGGYQMDVKYGNDDWTELNMVMGRTKVKPFEVYGGIAQAWRANGGAMGTLGYPTGNEEDLNPTDSSSHDRISHFEHGDIIWHESENRIEVVLRKGN